MVSCFKFLYAMKSNHQFHILMEYLNNNYNIGCLIFGEYMKILYELWQNIGLVFDSSNICHSSYNIFMYPPQGDPILYKYL